MTTPQDSFRSSEADEAAIWRAVGITETEGAEDQADAGEAEKPAQDTSYEEAIRAREAQAAEKLRAAEERERQVAERERLNNVGQQIRGFYNQQYQRYYQQYALDYGEDRAKELADSLAKKDAESGLRQFREKIALERLVSREEGVPPEILQEYWDEATMRQRAQNYKATGGADKAELEQLKKELAELKEQLHRGSVQPTNYNQPGSTGPGGNSYQDLLKSGKPLPAASEIDRITAKYLQG